MKSAPTLIWPDKELIVTVKLRRALAGTVLPKPPPRRVPGSGSGNSRTEKSDVSTRETESLSVFAVQT